jgi:hypothetical protein
MSNDVSLVSMSNQKQQLGDGAVADDGNDFSCNAEVTTDESTTTSENFSPVHQRNGVTSVSTSHGDNRVATVSTVF